MADATSRSISSCPPELSDATERAAAEHRTTCTDWLAETAGRRLRSESGNGSDRQREPVAPAPGDVAERLARSRQLLRHPRMQRLVRRSA